MTKWGNVLIISALIIAFLFLLVNYKHGNITSVYYTVSIICIVAVIYILARFSK
ncbi:hypothetical protein KW787_01435 [Candidatus Pacearchaeota archaeon]|nr:hypothetical protein [Candidatus Pacearchaeota archaeon]